MRLKTKTRPGRFADQKERDITMQTAKYFDKKGWFRFYFLMVNNKPVATELNLEYNGKMYAHLSGFDPLYSKYSVGNLLTFKVLELCFKNGLLEYDFMQGAESYKLDWTNKHRQNMNVICVNKKLSAIILCLSLKFLNLIKKGKRILLLKLK